MIDLIIWDSSERFECDKAKLIVYWISDGRPLGSNEYLISDLVEKNPGRYKDLYLKWVENLASKSFFSQELKNYFLLETDVNYWWMLTLNEKSNYDKSVWIDEVIKLLALEDFIKTKKVNSVNLFTNNFNLTKSLSNWCLSQKISFGTHHKKITNRIFFNQANIFLSLAWLAKYLFQRRSLVGGDKRFFTNPSNTTFFSYLFNIRNFGDKFESVYWGPLLEQLRHSDRKINWVHIYPGDSTLSNVKTAKSVIDGYNKSSSSLENHILVDSFIDTKVLVIAIIYWIKVITANIKVKKCIKGEHINNFLLWPFIESEWNESIYGKSALYYLLLLSIFKKITSNLPTQKVGIYLYENQRWEYGLIQMWKKFHHPKLVGYVHSSVSFWQLRYFHFMDHILKKNISDRPIPNLIAANGSLSFNSLKGGGFSESDVIELEALRYFHLAGNKGSSERSRKNLVHTSSADEEDALHLLVLGDLSKRRNDLHLKILENAIAKSAIKIVATIKPHPGNLVTQEKYSCHQIRISNLPINELLNDPRFNVAYVSSSSSSALDAYCAGLRVITSLDERLLNQSPLLGIKDNNIKFITNEAQLNSVLKTCIGFDREYKCNDIFNLNPELPAWKNLLEISDNQI